MKKIVLLICLVLGLLHVEGQVGIGHFRTHQPLCSFHSVAVAPDYVYAAADNVLMLLDKSTRDDQYPELSVWSKVDGLSDIGVCKIEYAEELSTLIVCYDNGNLDFIKKDKLYNISNVKDKQLSTSKRPEHVEVMDGKAYIVYPFGVVIIDLETLLIEDTWFTKRAGVQYLSKDITASNERYFVSTDRGIFSVSKAGNNQSNFAEWSFEATAGEVEYDHLAFFNNTVFANKNTGNLTGETDQQDTIYALVSGEWMPTMMTYREIGSLCASDSELIVCDWTAVMAFNRNLEMTNYSYLYDGVNYPTAKEAKPDNQMIWAVDLQLGLIQINRVGSYQRNYVTDGPFSLFAESICSHDGVVAVVPGSRKGPAYSNTYQYPSISWFENDTWHYNSDFYMFDPDKPTFDLTNVVINPNDASEWYVASWGNGLFKCKDRQPVALYTALNSPLDTNTAGKTYISGLAFDQIGNLWMTNSRCNKMLKMLEPDGTWHSYNIGSGVVTGSPFDVVAEHLLVDSRGYKWITFPRDDSYNHYHLVAFYDNGTYDNLSDDRLARVNMNAAAEVNSSTVYCVAEDHDGEIWIGTDKGVKVIYYPANIFDGNVYPRNILLEQDGYVSVLFEYEEVTAIAVDGANRKWVGTSKAGVFLMNEDGTEQLLHFTADDDPLLSNQITCISIDGKSGEVFFGTSKGIVSYRGTATDGAETYEKELPVFPNPVRPEYTGPIAVRGMKANSLCKITDASGKMVWQGRSNGGELIWNGLDHFGRRPSTGVYYVMASDEDGKEKRVAKILFIK